MKIICLTKRRPQQKDLVTRPYGRFFYLPYILAQKGHEVSIVLLSSKPERPLAFNRDGIQWYSESIFNWRAAGYIGTINSLIRKTKPDWIIGFSDTYYGILAEYFGQKHKINFAIDAYDNYESYLPWCKPLHMLWRNTIKGADVVTTAGPHLAQYLNRFRPHKKVHIVPMAADPTVFRPLDKQECRKQLNLPLDKKLIGYCGGINHRRGVNTVFRACELLHKRKPNTLFILSGRKQKNFLLPDNAKWLGYLPDGLMPILYNSMDVMLVINRLSAFGKYSYPIKLYEAMKCRIPVVAANTEPVKWILNGRKEHLANVGDPDDFAHKISGLLDFERIDYGEQNSWEGSCKIFETVLFQSD